MGYGDRRAAIRTDAIEDIPGCVAEADGLTVRIPGGITWHEDAHRWDGMGVAASAVYHPNAALTIGRASDERDSIRFPRPVSPAGRYRKLSEWLGGATRGRDAGQRPGLAAIQSPTKEYRLAVWREARPIVHGAGSPGGDFLWRETGHHGPRAWHRGFGGGRSARRRKAHCHGFVDARR